MERLRDSPDVELSDEFSRLLLASNLPPAFSTSAGSRNLQGHRQGLEGSNHLGSLRRPVTSMSDQEDKLQRMSAGAASSAPPTRWNRRKLLTAVSAGLGLFGPRLQLEQFPGSAPRLTFSGVSAKAFVAGDDQEVSGLVVLRVAEVCQFQEKLLRSLAQCQAMGLMGVNNPDMADQFGNSYCEGETYAVNSQQIIFGTNVMLKNSNLDGNMRLMIYSEIDEDKRDSATEAAVNIMNTFNKLIKTAAEYNQMKGGEYIVIADLYSSARNQLARFFNLLPQESQDKFYGYADAVRKYEEKVSKEDGIERMKL